MLNRRKVCGVLGELRDGVVTLGHRHQRQPDAGAASQRRIHTGGIAANDHGTDVRSRGAARLAALRLERLYDEWRHGGLVDVFVEIGPRDFLRGRPVTVDGKSGIATGINCDGRLELDTGHGERVLVEAGEVVYDR